jgi:hypothetical protein
MRASCEEYSYADNAGYAVSNKQQEVQTHTAQVSNALLYILHLPRAFTVCSCLPMSKSAFVWSCSSTRNISCYCTAVVVRKVLLCIQRPLMPHRSLAEWCTSALTIMQCKQSTYCLLCSSASISLIADVVSTSVVLSLATIIGRATVLYRWPSSSSSLANVASLCMCMHVATHHRT